MGGGGGGVLLTAVTSEIRNILFGLRLRFLWCEVAASNLFTQFCSFACVYSFSFTEMTAAVGLLVHAQVIILLIITCSK